MVDDFDPPDRIEIPSEIIAADAMIEAGYPLAVSQVQELRDMVLVNVETLTNQHGVRRLAACHALALVVGETMHDFLSAVTGRDGEPPVDASKIAHIRTAPEIVALLRASADVLEYCAGTKTEAEDVGNDGHRMDG